MSNAAMARALRIDLAGTWYHVMNRGHRGGTLYRTDADRRRFLGSVGELPERFGLEIHAFILMIQRRLQQLAEYAWSSWRVYGGAESAPGWLEPGVIKRLCGGRSQSERRKALREYTEEPIRQGRMDSPWEGLIGGVVLGEAEFAQRALSGRKVNDEEQTGARQLRRKLGWEAVVKAAEKVRGAPWDDWRERHGDEVGTQRCTWRCGTGAYG